MEEKKSVYHCDCCDYTTEYHHCIKKHVGTEKHKTVAEPICYVCDVDNKIILYICKICNKEFKVLSTKRKHQQKCKLEKIEVLSQQQAQEFHQMSPNVNLLINKLVDQNKSLTDKIEELMKTQSDQINELLKTQATQASQMGSIVKDSLNTVKTSVETNATVAKKSMSLIKHASINLKDAPALETLKPTQIYGMLGYKGYDKILTTKQKEEENERFIKIVIGRYENKNLAQFLGEMIVEYFKKQSTNDKNEFDCNLSPL